MKVKFTAEIIDDNGNVVGKRTSEEEGIPSMEEFDLSTRDGFLRDFDLLEKAVLKAGNQIGADITDELLDGTLKKTAYHSVEYEKQQQNPNSAVSPSASLMPWHSPYSQRKGSIVMVIWICRVNSVQNSVTGMQQSW